MIIILAAVGKVGRQPGAFCKGGESAVPKTKGDGPIPGAPRERRRLDIIVKTRGKSLGGAGIGGCPVIPLRSPEIVLILAPFAGPGTATLWSYSNVN